MNKLKIEDRNKLKLIEVFMSYADGFLSENITWNDIMPIVELIEQQSNTVIISYLNCEIRGWMNGYNIQVVSDSTILSVWDNCVNYIKWQNEQMSDMKIHTMMGVSKSFLGLKNQNLKSDE